MSDRNNPFYDFFQVEKPKPISTSEYLQLKLNQAIDQASVLMELNELIKDQNVRRYIELIQKLD